MESARRGVEYIFVQRKRRILLFVLLRSGTNVPVVEEVDEECLKTPSLVIDETMGW